MCEVRPGTITRNHHQEQVPGTSTRNKYQELAPRTSTRNQHQETPGTITRDLHQSWFLLTLWSLLLFNHLVLWVSASFVAVVQKFPEYKIFPDSSMSQMRGTQDPGPSRTFQDPPGHSKILQNPPRSSRTPQGSSRTHQAPPEPSRILQDPPGHRPLRRWLQQPKHLKHFAFPSFSFRFMDSCPCRVVHSGLVSRRRKSQRRSKTKTARQQTQRPIKTQTLFLLIGRLLHHLQMEEAAGLPDQPTPRGWTRA